VAKRANTTTTATTELVQRPGSNRAKDSNLATKRKEGNKSVSVSRNGMKLRLSFRSTSRKTTTTPKDTTTTATTTIGDAAAPALNATLASNKGAEVGAATELLNNSPADGMPLPPTTSSNPRIDLTLGANSREEARQNKVEGQNCKETSTEPREGGGTENQDEKDIVSLLVFHLVPRIGLTFEKVFPGYGKRAFLGKIVHVSKQKGNKKPKKKKTKVGLKWDVRFDDNTIVEFTHLRIKAELKKKARQIAKDRGYKGRDLKQLMDNALKQAELEEAGYDPMNQAKNAVKQWVQCDKCEKWREVAILPQDDEKWECSLLPDMSCSVPEDSSHLLPGLFVVESKAALE